MFKIVSTKPDRGVFVDFKNRATNGSVRAAECRDPAQQQLGNAKALTEGADDE